MTRRSAISSLSDIKDVLEELKNAEPRSCILLGASMLECALEIAIQGKLGDGKSHAETENLFDDQRGLFSNFERKISGAYFADIVGPRTRADMDIVRRIRNHCAHTMKRVAFEAPPIADRCRSFRLTESSFKKIFSASRHAHLSVVVPTVKDEPSLRGKYLFVVSMISSSLLLKYATTGMEVKEIKSLRQFFKATLDV